MSLIKQIREAREWDENMSENWMLADCGEDVEIRMAQSNVPLEESQTILEYITLLHNNIEAILDALEEAERKAKAGEGLAEAVYGIDLRPEMPDVISSATLHEVIREHNRKVKRELRYALDTYNKTVSK